MKQAYIESVKEES